MENISIDTSNHQSKENQLSSASTEDPDHVAISSLLHDLIFEILLRLPVKYFMRFKCVSKSWLSLITSRRFIKAHLNFIRDSSDNQRLLILRCAALDYYLKHCSLNSVLHAQVTDAVDVNYPPFEEPLYFVSVVGCCNGLICISIEETNLFLWNPSIRKSKRVPDLGIRLKEHEYYISWGFGYDEINDDYKIVAVVCILDDRGEPSRSEVMIYSIKTESWRRIQDFQGGYPLEEYGKFVSGKLHWSLDKEDGGFIGSLALATVTYARIKKPKCDEESDSDSDSEAESTLDVVHGCLCLLYDEDDDHTDVWIMKEYGVRESWTKVFTICVNKPRRRLDFTPLWSSENGEVLVFLGSKLVLYNPENATYGEISFRQQDIISYYAFVYTESLVSPCL